jgi:hypothetical protein
VFICIGELLQIGGAAQDQSGRALGFYARGWLLKGEKRTDEDMQDSLLFV